MDWTFGQLKASARGGRVTWSSPYVQQRQKVGRVQSPRRRLKADEKTICYIIDFFCRVHANNNSVASKRNDGQATGSRRRGWVATAAALMKNAGVYDHMYRVYGEPKCAGDLFADFLGINYVSAPHNAQFDMRPRRYARQFQCQCKCRFIGYDAFCTSASNALGALNTAERTSSSAGSRSVLTIYKNRRL